MNFTNCGPGKQHDSKNISQPKKKGSGYGTALHDAV